MKGHATIPTPAIERGFPAPDGRGYGRLRQIRELITRLKPAAGTAEDESFLWPNNVDASRACRHTKLKARVQKIGDGTGYRVWRVK